jgi:hypothetical protein
VRQPHLRREHVAFGIEEVASRAPRHPRCNADLRNAELGTD